MSYTIHDAIETLRHLEAAEGRAHQMAYGQDMVLGDNIWRCAMDLWERIDRIVSRLRDWPMGHVNEMTLKLIREDVAPAVYLADSLADQCRAGAGHAEDHPLHKGAMLAHGISEDLRKAIDGAQLELFRGGQR